MDCYFCINTHYGYIADFCPVISGSLYVPDTFDSSIKYTKSVDSAKRLSPLDLTVWLVLITVCVPDLKIRVEEVSETNNDVCFTSYDMFCSVAHLFVHCWKNTSINHNSYVNYVKYFYNNYTLKDNIYICIKTEKGYIKDFCPIPYNDFNNFDNMTSELIYADNTETPKILEMYELSIYAFLISKCNPDVWLSFELLKSNRLAAPSEKKDLFKCMFKSRYWSGNIGSMITYIWQNTALNNFIPNKYINYVFDSNYNLNWINPDKPDVSEPYPVKEYYDTHEIPTPSLENISDFMPLYSGAADNKSENSFEELINILKF